MGNRFISRATLAAVFVAVATSISFAPAAHAITYSTSGTSELFSLGDQMGTSSDYDQLAVTGVSNATPYNRHNNAQYAELYRRC